MLNDRLQLIELRSLDEYLQHAAASTERYEARSRQLRSLAAEPLKRKKNRSFTVRGYSYAALRLTDFEVSLGRDTDDINWRESLICPSTRTNNRQRAALHFLDVQCRPTRDSVIYASEQVTPFYQALCSRYPMAVGSEYLGSDFVSGSINENGVRHEDFTALSFESNSVDHIVSLDCLEHIPDFEWGFSEAARVLRSGGSLIATFPFDINKRANLIRAEVSETGEIIHHLSPEYHGDPVSDEGVLCYQVFGWEVLEQLKASGFKDASLFLMWSHWYGYLGLDQIIVFAKK